MAINETNGDGTPGSPAGVYRHKETGEELVLSATSRLGNPQAAAAERLGFEYVGPTPANIKQPVDPHYTAPATQPSEKSVAELEAELQAAKEREATVEDRKKDAEAVNAVADQSVANSNPTQTVTEAEKAAKKETKTDKKEDK